MWSNEQCLVSIFRPLESISSTFYEQLVRQYSCTKKLQSQTTSTQSFWRKNIGAKAAHKMLVKLTLNLLFVNKRQSWEMLWNVYNHVYSVILYTSSCGWYKTNIFLLLLWRRNRILKWQAQFFGMNAQKNSVSNQSNGQKYTITRLIVYILKIKSNWN